MEAPAYVNWGRTVVDCPADGCGDAREAQPGQDGMTCVNGHAFAVAWPEELPRVIAALAERPAQANRNWFPKGHPMAVAGGLPHGQTPDELRAETASHLDPQFDGDLDKVLAERGYRLDGDTIRRL